LLEILETAKRLTSKIDAHSGINME